MMENGPDLLPDDVAALRAELNAARAKGAQIGAELAVAKAKASEDLGVIARQKLRIEKLERQRGLRSPTKPTSPSSTKQSMIWRQGGPANHAEKSESASGCDLCRMLATQSRIEGADCNVARERSGAQAAIVNWGIGAL